MRLVVMAVRSAKNPPRTMRNPTELARKRGRQGRNKMPARKMRMRRLRHRQRPSLNPANWWVFISLFGSRKLMLAV